MTIIYFFELRTPLDSMIKHIFFESRDVFDFNSRLNHEFFEIRILNRHLLSYNVRIFLSKKCIDQSIY